MEKEEMRKKLIDLIEPMVESRGFELVELEYVPGRNGRLRLYIDRQGGVTLDHCELINIAVSDLLDYHDPISHSYNLEVSSPGVERPLNKKEHFQRFEGEKVKVKTREMLKGRRNFSGTLQSTGEDFIVVKLEEGELAEIPLAEIARAHLWLP